MKEKKEGKVINCKTKTERLKGIIKIQCQDGNWNYDPYNQGLANGLIMALSVLEEKEPGFLNPPKEWKRDTNQETLSEQEFWNEKI